MKMKKLTTIALAAAMAIGTFGLSVPAKAAENSTDYVLTIPASLNVTTAGWNATDGITAKVKSGDTFDTGKKLSVTAASNNGIANEANAWKLMSGTNAVGYNLAAATGTYDSGATPASWEFSADELNVASGTNKAMGIIVEDYSGKAAGTYTDTVTFTAKVASAGPEYYDKLVKVNSVSELGSGSTFYGRTITSDQAGALAVFLKAEKGRDSVIFYIVYDNDMACFKASDNGGGYVYCNPFSGDLPISYTGYDIYYISKD